MAQYARQSAVYHTQGFIMQSGQKSENKVSSVTVQFSILYSWSGLIVQIMLVCNKQQQMKCNVKLRIYLVSVLFTSYLGCFISYFLPFTKPNCLYRPVYFVKMSLIGYNSSNTVLFSQWQDRLQLSGQVTFHHLCLLWQHITLNTTLEVSTVKL